jgi:hypothetical protein
VATWDGPDLVARLLRVTGRPDTDQDLTETRAYAYLNDAHREVFAEVCAHVPHLNYGDPELMTTSDDGTTYFLAPSKEWVGRIEVYDRLGGTLLRPGPYWSHDADYVLEGSRSIRMPAGRTRTFASGPYVRYAAKPEEFDDASLPALLPTDALMAVVYLAAAKWARAGGYRDPAPYLEEYRAVLWGRDGQGGILATAKQQEDSDAQDGIWWRGINTGGMP